MSRPPALQQRPRVIVVGAGAVGLMAGLELARRGAEVRVIEADLARPSRQRRAASWAAAGMLGPVSEGLHGPPEAHPQLFELGLQSYDLWRQEPLFAKHGVVCGAALIARETPRQEACAALEVRARAAGREMRRLTDAEAEALIGRRVDPTWLVQDEAVVAPAALLAALSRALVEAGGHLSSGQTVDGLTEEGDRPAVRFVDGGIASADRIILAVGAWADPNLIEAAPPLARLTPAKGHLAPISAVGPAPTVRADDFYVTGLGPGDGRRMLGSTMEFGRRDFLVDRAAVAGLIRAARASGAIDFDPAPAARHAWAGVRPMSPDWAPMIGAAGPEGVLVAVGHSRNGWLLAPITAKILAALVFEETPHSLAAAFAADRV
jgi:glycine oxidase